MAVDDAAFGNAGSSWTLPRSNEALVKNTKSVSPRNMP
jgi:hypothetical protein